MLDILSKNAGDLASKTLLDQLNTLYRARPFTKAVPFNSILTTDGLPTLLWAPVNAYFEVAKVFIWCDTALTDLALLDSNVGQPFLFMMPPQDDYREYPLDPGYRSLLFNNAQLLIWDQGANTGAQVKGVILGWEVTKEGYYR